jgi:hypothetical protein|nr:MAG TPA: hypothetical protein [Caudoviricetes sp.]
MSIREEQPRFTLKDNTLTVKTPDVNNPVYRKVKRALDDVLKEKGYVEKKNANAATLTLSSDAYKRFAKLMNFDVIMAEEELSDELSHGGNLTVLNEDLVEPMN